MSTHLKKITDLARKLRKAKPLLKWTDAIKAASKSITGIKKHVVKKKLAKKTVLKKPTIVYTKNKQTGTSNKPIDKTRHALPPGKRISKLGKPYYEYRQRHTDKPGTMLGIEGIKKDLTNKLLHAQKCAADYLSKIAYEKSIMASDKKINKPYHNKKIKANALKLKLTKNLITKLKKLAK
jgi:hypothetical protein